jgi:hypothetical protein
LRNISGYLIGLSSPSATDSATTLTWLAEVVNRRADEIADVLDEQIIERVPWQAA